MQPGISAVIAQASVYAAHVYLAQSPIPLPRRARVVLTGLLIGALIQDQRAPRGQHGCGLDLRLDLLEHGLPRPGRVGHEMLQGLSIRAVQASVDVGKVPFGVHRELRTQIVVGFLARVMRAACEAAAKPQPKLVQAVSQLGEHFWWKPPALGVSQVGLGGVWSVIRLLIPQFAPP